MSWAAVIGAVGAIGGGAMGMLSKKGGTSSSSSVGPGAMAKSYWQGELQKSLGIQSGETSPTDLPEFKRMASQANTQSDQGMQRMVQMLSQRGITGGAAGQAIGNAEMGANQNLLKMIQDIYSTANQRGNTAAGQLGSRSKQQLPQQGTGPMPDMTGMYRGLYEMMNNNNQRQAGVSHYNNQYSGPNAALDYYSKTNTPW